jgi:hypothetical protein
VSAVNVLGLLGSLVIVGSLVEMMRRRRLREKYAVIWFLLAMASVIGALFPGLLIGVSDWIGLRAPTNLLFFIASLVLFVLNLQHSHELGLLEERSRTLAEEIGLLRLRLDQQGSREPEPERSLHLHRESGSSGADGSDDLGGGTDQGRR